MDDLRLLLDMSIFSRYTWFKYVLDLIEVRV